jgi:peptidoglycan/xylan/chitin deacetylase (PgdA/CDA1 family)
MSKLLASLLVIFLTGASVPAAKSEYAPVCLPVLMYHQILPGENASPYIITPERFESDLQTLKRHGYTTVTARDLINYTHKKKPLPDKPVMLTFDDGYESDYVYAYPLLKKHNAKAAFFIIGKYADLYSANVYKDITYSHLSWPQIREMHESGAAEFHSHTYDKHQGRDVLRGARSFDAYEKSLAKDFRILNEKYFNHIGLVPAALACPYGLYDEDLKQAVRRFGYTAIFNSNGRLNILTGSPEELYGLGRFCRSGDFDLVKSISEWESIRNTAIK